MKARTFHHRRNFYHAGKITTVVLLATAPNHLDFHQIKGFPCSACAVLEGVQVCLLELVIWVGNPVADKVVGGRQTVFVSRRDTTHAPDRFCPHLDVIEATRRSASDLRLGWSRRVRVVSDW
jgi:hypothetical protein